ncbi:hypothetical protein GGR48_001168 [Sphingomonas pseudosanguinis]|uniref:Uncharacterized protein n=2 Tax=Sphingomonas pseudosanguinis TaxID=413712 RepID=A0A7W6ABH4_9SPHN|nr:hypothetical protein [Sphingomonas pseudosanguinis]
MWDITRDMEEMPPTPSEHGELPPATEAPAGGATSRRALMLGALGASTVVAIRPALAQTTGSVLTCEIPIPDQARAGSYIALDGSTVPARTLFAFAPPSRPYTGEEVKRALQGGMLPNTNYFSNQAYLNYIRRLQRGQGGFTCYASLQMPGG